MLMRMSEHRRIVENLETQLLASIRRVNELEKETPEERRRRLTVISGMMPDEIAGVVAVARKQVIPHDGEEATSYADRVATAAVALAFAIKRKN